MTIFLLSKIFSNFSFDDSGEKEIVFAPFSTIWKVVTAGHESIGPNFDSTKQR